MVIASIFGQHQAEAAVPLTKTSQPSTVRKLRVELDESTTENKPEKILERNLETSSAINWSSKNSNSSDQAVDEVAPGAAPVRIREILNEGLINSPRVAATRALLGISKALYASATAMPNPALFRDEGAIAEGVRRIGPQQTFEPPWKLAFRLLTAKRQVQQTKLEILDSLWHFRNDMRRAYTEVVVAQESYQTLQDLAVLARKLLAVANRKLQGGAVPELDVLKAKLAYSQAEIDAARGRLRVTKSRQQLNVILGRPYSNPISATRLPTAEHKTEQSELLPDYSVPFPPVTDFIGQAFENRLELRSNKQLLKLNQAQLYSAYSNIIPNPTVGYGSSTNINLPTGPKLNGVFFTLNAELPIFSFSQGDIARLKANARQLTLQEAAIKNQITAEVTAAYITVLTARNRLKSYQEHVLADSAEVARLARRSYEAGQSDINATLLAQQANFQVRSDYLDAVSNYQTAITDLEQSMGEPVE